MVALVIPCGAERRGNIWN